MGRRTIGRLHTVAAVLLVAQGDLPEITSYTGRLTYHLRAVGPVRNS